MVTVATFPSGHRGGLVAAGVSALTLAAFSSHGHFPPPGNAFMIKPAYFLPDGQRFFCMEDLRHAAPNL